jgi:beta-glucosidase-like glycosyl hydrolase
MRASRIIGAGLMVAGAGAVMGAIALGLINRAPEPPPSPQASTSSTASAEATEPPSPSPAPSPEPALAWGPTVAEYEQALAEASQLTADEAIGQVLMPAVSSDDAEFAARMVRNRNLGGVIVMGGAVTSADGVRDLTGAIADVDRDWPVLIATDEEGGLVARLKPVLADMPAFMAAGAADNSELSAGAYAQHGMRMSGLGITMTFAPVADVTVGLEDPTIRTRSASSSPDRASRAVLAAAQGLADGGVVPGVKHFPGHGSVRADSHTSVAVQQRTLAQLERNDLVPFAAAIDEGVPVVMMGHIVVGEWGTLPASVNPDAYTYLREAMGFQGIIVTDAMNMEGVTTLFESGEAEVAAIRAGADMVVIPGDLDAVETAMNAALVDGTLSRTRLNEAAAKSILLSRWHAAHSPADVELERDYASSYSAAAAVVAARDCDTLVRESVRIVGGTEGQRARLADGLRERGVAIKGASAQTTVALVRGDRTAANADVVVALGGPWGLENSTADAYIAIWGGGPDQMSALAAILSGDADPHGTWPVKLNLKHEVCG